MYFALLLQSLQHWKVRSEQVLLLGQLETWARKWYWKNWNHLHKNSRFYVVQFVPILQEGSDGSGASWEQMKTNFPDLEVGKWPLNPSTKKKCCKKVHRPVYLLLEIEVVDSGSDCVHEHFFDLLVQFCSLLLLVNYFQFCFSSLKEIQTNIQIQSFFSLPNNFTNFLHWDWCSAVPNSFEMVSIWKIKCFKKLWKLPSM